MAGNRPRPPSALHGRRGDFNAAAGRAAFLSQFRGKCFRCLSKKHCRKDCRDPICCIIYNLSGHFGRECPQNPKRNPAAATARVPARDRLRFPAAAAVPSSPAPSPPLAMEGTHVANPARSPRQSCKVVMSTRALEHATFVLKRQAVLLTAADARRSSSTMAVRQELEARLRIPLHLLWITSHDPKDYLIIFDLSIHQDQVVKLGSLTVDGAKFFIKRWHEDDHAVVQTFNYHVRVVIEKMPQHFLSVEGAEEALGCRVDRLDNRTFERSHAKSFACWVWVWDVALIPTKHTFWLMERGAGRVEMLGFSPPGRVFAAPPSASRHDVLIHVDRIGLVPLRAAITSLCAERPALIGL